MNKTFSIFITLVIMLLTLGCESEIIHVDKSNTTGPWDGTIKHPYKTVQNGLNAAKADKRYIVEVHGGVYKENVAMKPGIVLREASKSTTVVIQGSTGSPTISAKDGCAIASLVIEGGSVGVLIELEATVHKKIKGYDSWTSVANCRILGENGIWLKTSTTLNFGKGIRRKPGVYISNNWLGPMKIKGGTGIRLNLTGPKTGELSISLDIVGNVIQEKFTGISLEAKGQGPNPGGFVRAQFTGIIENNLIFYGHTGISLSSENLGSAAPTIFNNTIANNSSHAIIASAAAGQDGDSSTHPDIVNNILAGNKGYGYIEFDKKTSAQTLNHNLFYQNSQGHYFDQETGKDINSQTGLNTPIVNNKVVFYSGSGNLVANPKFAKGNFSWNGLNWGSEKAGEFFLSQSGATKSPAIDAGLGSAKDASLHLQSTSIDFSLDTGIVDIGFHYTKPWKP